MATTGGTEQEFEELRLEIGSTYLIGFKPYGTLTLQEVYVDNVTDTSYKLIRLCSDGTYYVEWVTKEQFEEKERIIEYLDSPRNPPPIGGNKVKIEVNNPEYLKALSTPCPACSGSGRIPDDSVTAGDKTCPNCWGSRYIPAII